MDQRLREIEERYEDVSSQMSSPTVGSDPDEAARARKDVLRAPRDRRTVPAICGALEQADEARQLAAVEDDHDMASYLAAEAAEADRTAEKLRSELEHLLIPKDPNAGKNVVVEIRAGAGGQEAAVGW